MNPTLTQQDGILQAIRAMNRHIQVLYGWMDRTTQYSRQRDDDVCKAMDAAVDARNMLVGKLIGLDLYGNVLEEDGEDRTP